MGGALDTHNTSGHSPGNTASREWPTQPQPGEIDEAHQLAETVIRDVLSEQIGVPELSAGLQESLRDLADLVANDPETATVDQIHEVAAALRSVLDHHFSEHVSPR